MTNVNTLLRLANQRITEYQAQAQNDRLVRKSKSGK